MLRLQQGTRTHRDKAPLMKTVYYLQLPAGYVIRTCNSIGALEKDGPPPPKTWGF
jgi:hypothetical protein